jgi:hypothetical protein
MHTIAVPTKTFGNIEKNIVKIAIFTELDPNGKAFYKIEGQTGSENTAIEFIYDIEEAIRKLENIVKDILTRQTNELKIGRN